MIELAMFRNRAFSGALAANTVGMLALVGNAVFMTQYLQLVLGMSPLKAALWSLAPSVVVGAAAPLGAALARRIDRAYVLGPRLRGRRRRLRSTDPDARRHAASQSSLSARASSRQA